MKFEPMKPQPPVTRIDFIAFSSIYLIIYINLPLKPSPCGLDFIDKNMVCLANRLPSRLKPAPPIFGKGMKKTWTKPEINGSLDTPTLPKSKFYALNPVTLLYFQEKHSS
jgi:hypothetical protein